MLQWLEAGWLVGIDRPLQLRHQVLPVTKTATIVFAIPISAVIPVNITVITKAIITIIIIS